LQSRQRAGFFEALNVIQLFEQLIGRAACMLCAVDWLRESMPNRALEGSPGGVTPTTM
jgi:hypothetical protein